MLLRRLVVALLVASASAQLRPRRVGTNALGEQVDVDVPSAAAGGGAGGGAGGMEGLLEAMQAGGGGLDPAALMNNPMLKGLMDSNPEVANMLGDPEALKEQMGKMFEMMATPEGQEMTKNLMGEMQQVRGAHMLAARASARARRPFKRPQHRAVALSATACPLRERSVECTRALRRLVHMHASARLWRLVAMARGRGRQRSHQRARRRFPSMLSIAVSCCVRARLHATPAPATATASAARPPSADRAGAARPSTADADGSGEAEGGAEPADDKPGAAGHRRRRARPARGVG